MKRKEIFFKKDPSNTSITLLAEKATKYLKDNFSISDPWVVDYYQMHRENNYNESLDVVFFGDFLRKFLEGALWPFDSYRFWTISNASKNVIVNLFNIPAEHIHVIPRYSLFSKGMNDTKLEIKNIKKLYYVGQLRSEKNILLIMWTVFYLQNKFNLQVELNLIGEFAGDESFQKNVIELRDNLSWKIRPIVHGYIENFSFTELEKNSALINLSTFHYEDFDVAQAMAQEAGLFTITSEWGGHLDIEGQAHLKIPYQLIGECHDFNFESNLRGEVLADYLMNSPKHNTPITPHNIQKPVSITFNKLQETRIELLKRWGPSLYFILRLNLALARDSQKGFTFVDEYIQLFSGAEFKYTKALILDSNEEIHLIKERLSKVSIDLNTYLVQSKHISKKAVLDRLMQIDCVYIPLELSNFSSFNSLMSLLGDRCSKI